jgi:hypothetical protein
MRVYCASPYVLEAFVGGRAVLLDLRSHRCFGLNPTGATLWKELGRCEPEERLIGGLCARFDVSPEEAAAATCAFLHAMEARDLVCTRTETRVP